MVDPRNTHQERMRYIQVVRQGVQSVPERVPGYRDALNDALIEVLSLEQQHVNRRINIAQRVTAQMDALGLVLEAGHWDGSEAES